MLMAQRKLNYNEPFVDLYTEKLVGEPRRKPAKSKKVSQATKVKVQSLAVMLVVILMFGVIGAKTVHTNVVKGAEIRNLERDLQVLGAENDMLQVEADKLRSVARIENAALAMGMEKPEGTIYIASRLIQPEKAVGVEETQKTAAVPSEGEADSVFDNVLKIFTSFFASTQR